MKTTLSVVTATIVPFGFVVLAIAFLGHLLAKRRQERAAAERVNTKRPHWLASLGPDQWATSISRLLSLPKSRGPLR